MALFGKRAPCAICGGKVKGIFPWKIEGQPICNDCYGVVDLPAGMANEMNLMAFQGYRAFREENSRLREVFHTTQQVDFGWLDDKFLFDMSNGLLCMDKHLNKTIFEAKQIRSFVIREDSVPLFEGSAKGLVCHTSRIPQRVLEMEPRIRRYRMQEQMRRNAERMRDAMDGDRDNDTHHTTSTINIPEPFEKFQVEIYFDHPYWDVFTADMRGPVFSNTDPDVDDYLREYHNNAATMEQLARALMALAFPHASERSNDPYAPAQTQSAAPEDTITQIQRLKELVDLGVLTEEEFTAKKRQLLGL